PQVKRLCLAKPRSLSAALNLGVGQSTGDYFLLLNQDVRLEPDAVAEMVAAAENAPSCAAIAPKLKFWWALAFLNGLGNHVGAFSWGTDNGLGHLDLGQFDSWHQVPSACFAATLIPRRAWNRVGVIDEGFPLYYEDIEWSYRARLLGMSVCAAPHAIVYHAFGGKVPTGEALELSAPKLRNVVYGRLRFATKILGKVTLWRFLLSYIVEDGLSLGMALAQGNRITVKAYLQGWRDFWKTLPSIRQERKALQAHRVSPDTHLFESQREIPPPLIWHSLPELTWDLILNHYLPLFRAGRTREMPEFEHAKDRPRLLIVSRDLVDEKMAGPGIRYLEMARALSPDVEVTLAVPSEARWHATGIQLAPYREENPESLRTLVEKNDIALISGNTAERFPFLLSTRTRLVVDLYDPFLLENLHYYVHEPIQAQFSLNRQAREVTNRLVRLGDFIICGSERQRDFWMGALAANGRVNPATFAKDSSLRSLIDVVGIGIPDREPCPRLGLRGVHPAFPADCRIVLWGGGVWDWLDPLTLIRAWQPTIAKHPEARLVFLGTHHPNPLVPRHQMADRAEHLATEIGEKDRTIFFRDWLPHAEFEGILCEADVGVTLHPLHVETRYSIRTRVLDYFWARLPVLITDGDVTSEWVRQYQVGQVVPPYNVDAVVQALDELLGKPKEFWSPAFEPLHSAFSWHHSVEPLRLYCLQASYAPDREQRERFATEPDPSGTWFQRVARIRYIWRTEGFRVLLHRVWRYAQWRLARLS
ncbi:MAG: glycosyltransferase, partial [Chloroflexota bacterium]|nr:glycosyltransferase [Chloroflexota bacterium]